MKDYFDVWFLITNHGIDEDRLRKAIYITFNKRRTPMDNFTYIFSDEFKTDTDKARQWKAFLNRSSIDEDHSFEEALIEIESFIKPII